MEIKAYNLISPNGNMVANQYTIRTKKYHYFQSYDTIIAKHNKITDKTILDTNALNYSRTTSKYLYSWLRMNRKQIEQKIKDKEILLKNLN